MGALSKSKDLSTDSAKLGIEGSALQIIHFDEEWQSKAL